MPKVTIANLKKDIEVAPGSNLRLELRKAGIPVYSGLSRFLNCHGLGLCGTCKVLVKQGMDNLSAKTGRERFKLATMVSAIGHEDEMRLSCQVQVNGDCTIETTPALNLYGENFWQKPYPNK